MCGRYTQTLSLDELRKRFGAAIRKIAEAIKPSFNLSPGQIAAIITREDQCELTAMRWGLVPSWAKDLAIGNRMINARSETLAEKPSFKQLIRRRRCLVPADGFFEWKKHADGRGKIPVHYTLKDREPFAFAGLWDQWEDPEGVSLQTFTIITTQANELVNKVHNRMPVIIGKDRENEWLDLEQDEPADLQDLLQPFPAEQMEAYPVSTLVNSPRNNSPECIRAVPEEQDLFGADPAA